jgi:hypothetical protein
MEFNNQSYLYFPECKIIKAQLVPKSTAVIIFYIKSLKNTPKHYPLHTLLEGKIEFSFSLELTENFQKNKYSDYFNLFECNLNHSPSKLIGKKVSALILFNPNGEKKLDTVGLGSIYDLITIYNDIWNHKEMRIVSQSSKLYCELPNKGKIKVKKI